MELLFFGHSRLMRGLTYLRLALKIPQCNKSRIYSPLGKSRNCWLKGATTLCSDIEYWAVHESASQPQIDSN
jgi:hypothetical protein